MCSNNPSGMMPYGLKIPTPTQYVPYPTGMTQMAMDLHRAQLYDYSARLQYTLRGYPAPIGLSPYQSHPADPFGHAYLYKHDPRARFVTEEPKPSQSYIGLISMAILSHPDTKMVLSDIYQYILDNYAYFRNRGPGWRNSIRHNLSLNDCFIKSGRSANGKGHYWAIHPANLEDFKKGDFRRRRAQRRVRRHMGLSIGDDEDSLSPQPSNSVPIQWEEKLLSDDENSPRESDKSSDLSSTTLGNSVIPPVTGSASTSRKRLFDMESLLAPESRPKEQRKVCDVLHRVQTVASPVAPRVITAPDASPIKPESESNDNEPVPDSTQDSSHSEPTTPSPVENSESRLISPDEHRGLWKSPNLIPGGMSAFPNTSSCTWSNISPFAYPLMSAPYPLAVPTAALSVENVQRWRESFCRINEQPMEKTFKLDEQ